MNVNGWTESRDEFVCSVGGRLNTSLLQLAAARFEPRGAGADRLHERRLVARRRGREELRCALGGLLRS